jgi:hypothetical protein
MRPKINYSTIEKEQMTVIKTTISYVNSTLQRINQKERNWKMV